MNFDEALSILGIDRSAGKKGARRAYIKLIKVHKPDRDPVMFRRVREAYERVKDDIEIYARFYTPPPDPVRPEPISAPSPQASEPEPEPEPEPELPEPEPEPDMEAFFQRSADQNAHYSALFEKGLRDPPRIDPIVDAPRIDPIVEHPPRVEMLDDPLRIETHAERPIRIEPRSTPPSAPPPPTPSFADARAFERGPSPAFLLQRAWAVFNDGGAAPKVERLAQRAFDTAHRDPEADQPPPVDAINLCLALFTNGRIVPARRVTRAMRVWLSETGLERTVMGGKLAASLAVLQALISLPADSPAYPISRIARATHDAALESAQPPLRTFARETPFSALTSADHFRAHAPLLDGLYGELLRASTAVELSGMTAEVPARRGRGCLWIFIAMIGLFTTLSVMRSCGGSSDSRYRPPALEIPKINIPSIPMPKIEIPRIETPKLTLPPMQTPAGEVRGNDARRMREFTSAPSSDARTLWVRVLCAEGDDHSVANCGTIISFQRALTEKKCPMMKHTLMMLERSRMPNQAHRGAVVLARQQYEQACPKR